MQNSGFTLLELSIVLVIIGLIIGGITVGSELVKQAEIRAVTTEAEQVITALRTYRLKYNALAGDHANAQQYFTSSACPDAAPNFCNGNGTDVWNTTYERFRAWQHMALSGIYPGSFTGVAESGSVRDSLIGVNVPGTSRSGVGINFWDHGQTPYSDGQWFLDYYGRVMILGRKVMPDGLYESGGFTTSEMADIDQKLDDGFPGRGRVMSYKNASCTSTTDPATAVYRLDQAGNVCRFVLKTGF